MGKSIKKVTKAITKTVKAVAKPAVKATTNMVKSVGNATGSAVGAVGSLAKGDVKGAVRKVTDVAANAGNIATMGSVDLTGRKNGFVNVNKEKYIDSVIGVNAEKTPEVKTSEIDAETDGLLQYVSDLRTRKSRRNRASTNNTDGNASGNVNKLSGTTALGV